MNLMKDELAKPAPPVAKDSKGKGKASSASDDFEVTPPKHDNGK